MATAANNTDLMLLCNFFLKKSVQALKKQTFNPENVLFYITGPIIRVYQVAFVLISHLHYLDIALPLVDKLPSHYPFVLSPA